MDPAYIFLLLTLVMAMLVLLLVAAGTLRPKARRYFRSEYGEQYEIDLRLTYKRFKELYPFSQLSYREYKKLQMETAFKRAVSSEKNKRMVR